MLIEFLSGDAAPVVTGYDAVVTEESVWAAIDSTSGQVPP
jgi:hypothetical protein